MAYFSHEKLKTKSTADTKAIVQPEPEAADHRIFRRKDNNIRPAIIFHEELFIFNTNWTERLLWEVNKVSSKCLKCIYAIAMGLNMRFY